MDVYFIWNGESPGEKQITVAVTFGDDGMSQIVTGYEPGSYQHVDYYISPSGLMEDERFETFDEYVNTLQDVPTSVALQLLGAISAVNGSPSDVIPFDVGDW